MKSSVKKLLSILGVAFAVLVVVASAAAGYAIFMGAKLDASSKAYVDQTIPAIVGTWSSDKLLQEESSSMRRLVGEPQLVAAFRKFSLLGKLVSYGGSKGESTISLTPRGKVVTARYESIVRCERGEVVVTITLIEERGMWRILGFFVNSDELLK